MKSKIGMVFFIIGLLVAGSDTNYHEYIQFMVNCMGAGIAYLGTRLIQKGA